MNDERTERVLLFAYGLLQPGPHAPRTAIFLGPDHIRGILWHLGDYPGARDIGQVQTWIPGVVISVRATELPALDAFEDVDLGEFARVVTTTRYGAAVYVYEHRAPLPDHARRIAAWNPQPAAGS